MLNKWTKTIFGIGFALLFCFLCVGFAALHDELQITGTASAKANLTNEMAPVVFDELKPEEGSWPDEALAIGNYATKVVFGRFSDYEDSLGTCTASINIDKLGTGGVQLHYDATFADTTAYILLHTDHEQIIAPTTMDGMFAFPNLEKIYLNGMLDTSRTQSMMDLFSGCAALTELDLSGFDTRNVTNMYHMFYGCLSLETIYASNAFVTKAVTDSNDMFTGCEALVGGNGTPYSAEYVDKEYARIDTTETPGYFTRMPSNILKPSFNREPTEADFEIVELYESYYSILYEKEEDGDAQAAEIREKILKAQEENMGDGLAYYACMGPYLQEAFPDEDIPLLKVDTLLKSEYGQVMQNATSVTFMKASAFNPGSMASVSIDVDDSGGIRLYYDPALLEGTTGNTAVYIVLAKPHEKIVATDCSRMFNFESLTEINFNNMLDTSQVTYMEAMFRNCSVTELDLSGFVTMNVNTMREIFAGCHNLTRIVFSENFGANCSDMADMFVDCIALENLDLSNLNTENCGVISYMFKGCISLTELDLSLMDTQNCTADAMVSVFSGCTKLKTIYVNPELWVVDESIFEHGAAMFTGCEALVGGSGTTYDANHVGPAYAKVDGGVDDPGYFTAKTDDTPLAP